MIVLNCDSFLQMITTRQEICTTIMNFLIVPAKCYYFLGFLATKLINACK